LVVYLLTRLTPKFVKCPQIRGTANGVWQHAVEASRAIDSKYVENLRSSIKPLVTAVYLNKDIGSS
jgi:hypothetical protein